MGIAEGHLTHGGAFCIEEIDDEEEEEDGENRGVNKSDKEKPSYSKDSQNQEQNAIIRRLIFLSNQGIVQTEAKLITARSKKNEIILLCFLPPLLLQLLRH